VRTGKRLWTFHTIPQAGEFGAETWENDSWKTNGNTGVWTIMSADQELGYVYLAGGNAIARFLRRSSFGR
jgi:quinoprotein glucose dehydrogenase